MRLPEPLKPALRTLLGVGALAGVGLWALEAERRASTPATTTTIRARDLTGRATLVAALTVAFAAPSPLGNAAVVLVQRLLGGTLGAALAAGLLAVPPAATGARLAAACIPLIAAAAVYVGQDCGLQYGAQFCVLSFILIAVEGSASGGGAAGGGWLALARGGGVLVGSAAAGLLGVCVCPQAASNAATARLGDALGGVGGLVRAATAAPVGVGEGEGDRTPAPTTRGEWLARPTFLRSSAPLVSPAGPVTTLTTADLLVGATGPEAEAALDAAVGVGGAGAPPPPP